MNIQNIGFKIHFNMKIIKSFFLASLLLASFSLHAQDAPVIERWGTLGVAGLAMGFAPEWEVVQSPDLLIGTSPDGQVTILSLLAAGDEITAVINNLEKELDKTFEGLVLAPIETYELNGMQLYKTTGIGKMRDENHFTNEVHVDVLETPVDGDKAFALVVTYGAEEAITQYFDEILLTLNSFIKE
jgi:hypothetical protein